jgi:hypothetical protein
VNVLVFSRNKKLPEKLKLRKRKGLVDDIRYARLEDFSGCLKKITGPTLCYLDLAGIEEQKIAGYLRTLRRRDGLIYGVIDSSRKIKDVAGLFHDGAVDYVDRGVLETGIQAARLKNIRDFVQAIHPAFLESAALETRAKLKATYVLSGNSWDEVEKGREYTFAMMFIELDGKEQMEKKYGVKNLSIALSSFRSYIDNFVRPFGGRVWIWFSFGGIVLFPFNARSCPALTCGFRLMLFKHMYDIEGSHFPRFLSFRVVLQIGSTAYTEENTGHIVSESLNSIFHLGQQFAKPGYFYVTEEVLHFSHPALRSFFHNAGSFEGGKILRMRLPLHLAQGK